MPKREPIITQEEFNPRSKPAPHDVIMGEDYNEEATDVHSETVHIIAFERGSGFQKEALLSDVDRKATYRNNNERRTTAISAFSHASASNLRFQYPLREMRPFSFCLHQEPSYRSRSRRRRVSSKSFPAPPFRVEIQARYP